jgi:cytochrome c-type biogenesis protein CcmH/NrfG
VLTLLFRLPLLPVRGVIRLAELIQDEAERELHDPALIRRQLEEAERERLAGNISEEELSQAEEEATSRLDVTEQPGTDTPGQAAP